MIKKRDYDYAVKMFQVLTICSSKDNTAETSHSQDRTQLHNDN